MDIYSQETKNITFLGNVGSKEGEEMRMIMIIGRVTVQHPVIPAELLIMPTFALKSVPVWN